MEVLGKASTTALHMLSDSNAFELELSAMQPILSHPSGAI